MQKASSPENIFFPIISIMPKNRRAYNKIPYFFFFSTSLFNAHILIPSYDEPSHNLHNFRTILLNRQWVAFLKIKQIQAQKGSFSILCTNAKTNCARKKSPTQNPLEDKF